MPSPTALSLARLRRDGFTCDIVERWVKVPGQDIRRDCFHCGDVLAVRAIDKAFVLIQTTSISNLPARVEKSRRQPELVEWIGAGGKFWLHGWVRREGGWAVKVVELAGADLTPVVVSKPPRKRPKSRWQPAELF